MAKTLTIEIPDWAEERHIFIFAGIELMAWKPAGEDAIHRKTKRCVMCGWCCENLLPDGPCIYLEPEGQVKVCGLHTRRPFNCSWADPKITKPKGMEHCSIEYEVVE